MYEPFFQWLIHSVMRLFLFSNRKKMKKVSFDFDATLSRKDVQSYARSLIAKGFDVWICTSRLEPEKAPTKEWNDDLFLVADDLGIKRENIIFCNYETKAVLLKDKGFVFHIDDDNIELSFIRTDTDIKPIFLFGNKKWFVDCDNAIQNIA